jgi:hypothetical protein
MWQEFETETRLFINGFIEVFSKLLFDNCRNFCRKMEKRHDRISECLNKLPELVQVNS